MAKKKDTAAELTVIKKEELQPELMEIAQAGGIDLSEASAIGLRFAPYMQFVNDHAKLIDELDSENPTEEMAEMARKYRLALVKNRGENGMKPVKEELKSNLLIKTRLIDNYNNLVENSSKLSEQKAESIEKHQERVKAAALQLLAEQRIELLSEFGPVSEYIDFKSMDEASFNKMYENEKLAFEAKKRRDEEVEAKRIREEKEAEERRIEDARKAEEERLKKEEEGRIERERIERENAELKKQQEQREEAAKKRIAKELAKVEKFAKILVADGFKLSNNDSYIPKDQHRWCKDEYSVSFGQLTLIENEEELNELIDLTNSRILQRKELEKIQAEKDAEIEIMKAELEAERLRKEKELSDKKEAADKAAKAEALKGDKQKVNDLFVSIRDIPIPEFETEAAKDIAKGVRAGIEVMLQGIKDLAVHVK